MSDKTQNGVPSFNQLKLAKRIRFLKLMEYKLRVNRVKLHKLVTDNSKRADRREDSATTGY